MIMDIESEESIQSAKADCLKISPTLDLLSKQKLEEQDA